MTLNRLASVPCLLAALFAFPLFAQDASPPMGNADHPHGPPPEAISACVSKTIGSSCSFTGRRGESLTGTCETHRPHSQAAQEGASMASTAEVMACHPPRPAMGGQKPGDQQAPPPNG